MSFHNLRPGVYSDYQISAHYATPRSVKTAGLVCRGTAITGESVLTITSKEERKALIRDTGITQRVAYAVDILLDCGVKTVHVSLVGSDYAQGFAALETVKNIGCLLTDAENENDLLLAVESIRRSSASQRERLLLMARSTPLEACTAAELINSKRCIILCGSGIYKNTASVLYSAAAFAGLLLREYTPAINLNGAVLPLLERLMTEYKESDIQNMLASGVTPLETVGSGVEVIRGVTTQTTVDGEKNATYRSINTVLIIDDVISTIRQSLKAKLHGTLGITATIDGVATQVMVELEEKQAQGLIARYEAPRVYSHTEDPEICVVEISFHVAHVISQIHLKAHVRL